MTGSAGRRCPVQWAVCSIVYQTLQEVQWGRVAVFGVVGWRGAGGHHSLLLSFFCFFFFTQLIIWFELNWYILSLGITCLAACDEIFWTFYFQCCSVLCCRFSFNKAAQTSVCLSVCLCAEASLLRSGVTIGSTDCFFFLWVSSSGLREHFSGLEEKYFLKCTWAPKTCRWSETFVLIISPHYSVCCLPRSRLLRYTQFPLARTGYVEVCLLN